MEQSFKNNFSDFVESLKRSQRADLVDENSNSILEELYTDPFDGDLIMKHMLNDQTTLLIGRKGTGKSTIINKFQHDIRKTKDRISLYIDVRTIHSKTEGSHGNNPTIFEAAMNSEMQAKLFLYSAFIEKTIEEIKKEVVKNVFEKNGASKWSNKIRQLLSSNSLEKKSETQFLTELDNILKYDLSPKYDDISYFQQSSITDQTNSHLSYQKEGGYNIQISQEPAIGMSKSNISNNNLELSNTSNYSQVLKRRIDISGFSEKLKNLLQSVGIKKVYFCLDDSSELSKEALEVFIKTLVAPLHNDSEGFFRFKISFYPERNVLPEIDRTKIDTIFLDYYEMYKSSGLDKVEEQAINFVKRLIQKRLKYYFSEDIEQIENSLFDTKNTSMDEYYQQLFYACSCVPRNIGRLLYYCEKKSITQGKLITKTIIQESAKEQYINEVEPLIIKDEFFQYKSYSEIYKRTQLKELVNYIIKKARENKKHIGESSSNIFKDYTTSNAPSHLFFVRKDVSGYLSTLEINNFITRISEQKDKGDYTKDGKFYSNDIIVYTLNYGLCQKENIVFEEPNNRKYRIERIFDFNKLIEDWAKNSAFVECINCSAEYDISEWEKIQEFDCYCKKCKKSYVCQLKTRLQDVAKIATTDTINIELKPEQLRIIHSLYIEDYLTENQIAGDLDVSSETIRAYLRSDRVLRSENWVGKEESSRKYYITEKSLSTIYANTPTNN